MSSNLTSKYEKSYIYRIRRFILGLFNRNKKMETIENIEVNKDKKVKEKVESINTFSQMKEMSKKSKLKEEILSMIEDNPNLIETLSVVQLEELKNMYTVLIEEKDRKIRKIKRELAS